MGKLQCSEHANCQFFEAAVTVLKLLELDCTQTTLQEQIAQAHISLSLCSTLALCSLSLRAFLMHIHTVPNLKIPLV